MSWNRNRARLGPGDLCLCAGKGCPGRRCSAGDNTLHDLHRPLNTAGTDFRPTPAPPRGSTESGEPSKHTLDPRARGASGSRTGPGVVGVRFLAPPFLLSSTPLWFPRGDTLEAHGPTPVARPLPTPPLAWSTSAKVRGGRSTGTRHCRVGTVAVGDPGRRGRPLSVEVGQPTPLCLPHTSGLADTDTVDVGWLGRVAPTRDPPLLCRDVYTGSPCHTRTPNVSFCPPAGVRRHGTQTRSRRVRALYPWVPRVFIGLAGTPDLCPLGHGESRGAAVVLTGDFSLRTRTVRGNSRPGSRRGACLVPPPSDSPPTCRALPTETQGTQAHRALLGRTPLRQTRPPTVPATDLIHRVFDVRSGLTPPVPRAPH